MPRWWWTRSGISTGCWGALGGAGSILTVPALVYLLGQSAHQSTTASLMVVGTAAAVGALVYAHAGRARLRAGATFGVLGIAGSYAGSRASAAVPASVQLAGFGLLMLAVAVMMILRRRSQAQRRRRTHTLPGILRASEQQGRRLMKIDEDGAGQVLNRLRRAHGQLAGAGACHSDLHLMRDFEAGLLLWEPPFTLGHENAGWVHSLGAGVAGLEVGQPVAPYGPWGCGTCERCRLGVETYCENQIAALVPGGRGGLGLDSRPELIEDLDLGARSLLRPKVTTFTLDEAAGA